MREAVWVRGKHRLPFGRVTTKSKNSRESRFIVLADQSPKLVPRMPDTGEVANKGKPHLYQRTAVRQGSVTRGPSRSVGDGSEINTQRLQGPGSPQQGLSRTRVFRRKKLHRDRRAERITQSINNSVSEHKANDSKSAAQKHIYCD